MQNRIALIVMAVFSMLVLIGLDIQMAYAQTSATITLFQTGNTSDDACTAIAQTGSIVWLGCYASASTTLRINAMSGNTTLATTTLASQSQHFNKFFPVDSNNIVTVDISSATSDIVRKYNISGSTITNPTSLTLTGCNSDTVGLPTEVSGLLYVLCTSGDIKVVDMNSMILQNTLTTTIQGNCANPMAIFMLDTDEGLVYCDNTELNSFTVSGSTITFVDEVTGWTSITLGVGLIAGGINVWAYDFDTGSSIDVVNINTSDLTFTSSPVTLPSQSDVNDIIVGSGIMFALDKTDNNILAYNITEEQPAPAIANFGVIDAGQKMIVGSDNISIWVASAVVDVGRFYSVTDIEINGTPFGGGGGGATGGTDCTLPSNANILICRLNSDEDTTGGVLLPRVGVLITTNINNILCSILPIDCITNPNIATNGVGYIWTIVLFAIMVSIFFVASNGQLNKIPTFIWMMSAIALLGGLVAVEFLDATFLVIGIIVIVALAAMQIRNSITRGFDFASGDF